MILLEWFLWILFLSMLEGTVAKATLNLRKEGVWWWGLTGIFFGGTIFIIWLIMIWMC